MRKQWPRLRREQRNSSRVWNDFYGVKWKGNIRMYTASMYTLGNARERERFERRRFRKIRKETRIEDLRRLLAHTIRLAMGRAYGQGKSFCSSRLFSVFTRTTVQRICTHASLRQEITFSFLGREWYFADERNRTFRSGRVPFTHG